MANAEPTRDGRGVFGAIILIGIAVGGGLGLFVGVSYKSQHISMYDVVVFHPTPTSMAVYGAVAATVFFGVLLSIVVILSRFDQDAV